MCNSLCWWNNPSSQCIRPGWRHKIHINLEGWIWENGSSGRTNPPRIPAELRRLLRIKDERINGKRIITIDNSS